MSLLKKSWYMLLSCIVLGISYEDDIYEAGFEYQDNLDWNNNISEFWFWLKLMRIFEEPVTCKSDQPIQKNITIMKSLAGPYPCENGTSGIEYIGELNEHKIPNGYGKIIRKERNISKTIGQLICYDLRSDINSIEGTFENGVLNGPAIIEYAHLAKMQVTFSNGTIQGLIQRFDNSGNIEMIGNYYHGVPHGPFWIGKNSKTSSIIFIHFDNGQIIPNNVALGMFKYISIHKAIAIHTRPGPDNFNFIS